MSATTTTTTKRHRDHHDGDTQPPTTKRHKDSYINLVHAHQDHAHAHEQEQEQLEQQEPMHDLSYLFACISPDPFLSPDTDSDPTRMNKNCNENNDDEDEKESVIRHLLEASDDELGLPKVTQDGGGGDDVAEMSYYGDICDGLWELEDEVANYYTLLQSELFMH